MWTKIGNVFAGIGKGAVKVAIWAEAHPEVLQGIVTIVNEAAAAKK